MRHQDIVYREETHVFTVEQKEELLSEINGGVQHLITPLNDTSLAIIGDRLTKGMAEQCGLSVKSLVL